MSRSRYGLILATLLVLGSSAGCRLGLLAPLEHSSTLSENTGATLAASGWGHDFYPLEIGNRWHYARTFDVRWQDASGAPQSFHIASAIERELVCQTPLAGRSYTAERSVEIEPTQTYTSWVYYRQDRRGLYEADEPTPPPCEAATIVNVAARAGRLSAIGESGRRPDDPAVRAAEAVLEQRLSLIRYSLGLAAPSLRRPRPAPGEITRLAYPLHPGQSWIIRDSPRFSARVEGVDVLRLPAGKFVADRIRIDSEFFGPNDRVLVWYGRQGFLRLEAHLESEGRDENGNPTGLVFAEDREVLDGIDIEHSRD